ncbi:MAG: hypothetical protein LHW56_00260 [Candidatus Cloacimonetes bacterium]|nr:hypothetical protein [Candidatus Cloacimonadota bacterium]MDY0171317.1 hypothetical protein [Candidatus Cloacimonadaceae bacterium]
MFLNDMWFKAFFQGQNDCQAKRFADAKPQVLGTKTAGYSVHTRKRYLWKIINSSSHRNTKKCGIDLAKCIGIRYIVM